MKKRIRENWLEEERQSGNEYRGRWYLGRASIRRSRPDVGVTPSNNSETCPSQHRESAQSSHFVTRCPPVQLVPGTSYLPLPVPNALHCYLNGQLLTSQMSVSLFFFTGLMIWIYQGHWLLDFCTICLTTYNIHCGWLNEPGADAWTSSKAKLCVHKPVDVWTAGTGGKRSYFVWTLQAQCCLHAVFRSHPKQCPPGEDSVIDSWCLPCVRQQVLLPFTHPVSPWMLCFPSPPSVTAPPSKGKADPITAHLNPCFPGHLSHSQWNPWAIHHRPSLHPKGSHYIGLLALPQTQQGHSYLRVLEASSSIRNILRHQIPVSTTPYCLQNLHWCKTAPPPHYPFGHFIQLYSL